MTGKVCMAFTCFIHTKIKSINFFVPMFNTFILKFTARSNERELVRVEPIMKQTNKRH